MATGKEVRAGKAFVELSVRDRLDRGLRRAQRKLRALGNAIGSLGTKLLGLTGLLAAPLGLAIKAASNMEEVMNKFNVVFGESATVVKAWGDDLANQLGRSKRQIAEFLAESQDLLVPLGFDEAQATDLSKQITELSIDLASFNNMADADVLRDIKAALTGSGEVMKKYGVIVSEAAVKQELLNQGLDPKFATNQEKVMARLNIILAGTTAAQGDATRSAGSFANQMKALRGKIEDAAGAIGKALLPVVTPLVEKAQQVVSIVAQWISRNQGLVVSVAKVIGVVAAAGVVMISLGLAAKALAFAMGLATAAISITTAALGVMTTVATFLLSPIGALTALLVALGAAIIGVAGYALFTTGKLDFLAKGFNQLNQTALKALQGITDALAAGDVGLASKIFWLTLKAEWQRGVLGIKTLWGGLTGFLADAMEGAAVRLIRVTIGIQTFIANAWLKVLDLIESISGKVGIDVDAGGLRGIVEGIRDRTRQGGDLIADQIVAIGSKRRAKFLTDTLEGGLEVLATDRERNSAIEQARRARLDQERESELPDVKVPDLEIPEIKIPPLEVPKIELPDFEAIGAGVARKSSEVRGTFSAAALGRTFGGGRGTAEKHLDVAREHLREAKRLLREVKNGGLAFT